MLSLSVISNNVRHIKTTVVILLSLV